MILNYDDIVTSRDLHSTKQKLPLVDSWYVALTKFKSVARSYIQFSNCTLLGIQQLVIQQTQQVQWKAKMQLVYGKYSICESIIKRFSELMFLF